MACVKQLMEINGIISISIIHKDKLFHKPLMLEAEIDNRSIFNRHNVILGACRPLTFGFRCQCKLEPLAPRYSFDSY